MSHIFWKNFYLCFSKLKSPPSPSKQSLNPSPLSPTTSTLFNNFHSLYDLTSSTTSKSLTSTTTDFFSSSDESDSDSPPDFAIVSAAQRFFFSSPGCSNSIFDSPDSPPESSPLLAGAAAIQTYSPDPYTDFRRSMQEMVEAREFTNVKADWDFLHELLLCYLSLNAKNNHKFIISAFADLIISLVPLTTTHGGRKIEDCHHCLV